MHQLDLFAQHPQADAALSGIPPLPQPPGDLPFQWSDTIHAIHLKWETAVQLMEDWAAPILEEVSRLARDKPLGWKPRASQMEAAANDRYLVSSALYSDAVQSFVDTELLPRLNRDSPDSKTSQPFETDEFWELVNAGHGFPEFRDMTLDDLYTHLSHP